MDCLALLPAEAPNLARKTFAERRSLIDGPPTAPSREEDCVSGTAPGMCKVLVHGICGSASDWNVRARGGSRWDAEPRGRLNPIESPGRFSWDIEHRSRLNP